MYHRPPMYIHIGYTLSPKKEVGVGEEESSGIREVEVVVCEMYTGHAPVVPTPESVLGASAVVNATRSRCLNLVTGEPWFPVTLFVRQAYSSFLHPSFFPPTFRTLYMLSITLVSSFWALAHFYHKSSTFFLGDI